MKVSRWRSSLRSKVDSCDKIEHCAMQLQCNAMLPKVLWLALQLCNAMHCLAMLAKVFWFLLQLCICNATAQCSAVQRSATLAKVLWLPPITAHCFRPQWATPIRLCFNANQSTADQCNVSERSVQESANCSEVGFVGALTLQQRVTISQALTDRWPALSLIPDYTLPNSLFTKNPSTLEKVQIYNVP